MDVLADGVANGANDGEIFLMGIAAQAHLDGVEISFGEQFRGFLGGSLGAYQSEPTRVVGLDGLSCSAQDIRQGFVLGPGQRIPTRHVEARHRHHGNALMAHQSERLAGLIKQGFGLDLAAGHCLAQPFQRRYQTGVSGG